MPGLVVSGLKPKAQELLAVLSNDPFQNPPPFEKLVGGLFGYSRRINIQHRSCTKFLPRRKPFAFCECGRITNSQARIRINSNDTPHASSFELTQPLPVL